MPDPASVPAERGYDHDRPLDGLGAKPVQHPTPDDSATDAAEQSEDEGLEHRNEDRSPKLREGYQPL